MTHTVHALRIETARVGDLMITWCLNSKWCENRCGRINRGCQSREEADFSRLNAFLFQLGRQTDAERAGCEMIRCVVEVKHHELNCSRRAPGYIIPIGGKAPPAARDVRKIDAVILTPETAGTVGV